MVSGSICGQFVKIVKIMKIVKIVKIVKSLKIAKIVKIVKILKIAKMVLDQIETGNKLLTNVGHQADICKYFAIFVIRRVDFAEFHT